MLGTEETKVNTTLTLMEFTFSWENVHTLSNAEIKMRICAQSTLKAKQRWFNKGLLEEGNCDLTHKGQRILVHKEICLLYKGFVRMDGPEAQRQTAAH